MVELAEELEPSSRILARITDLAAHPDNPRPHLGDLSEMVQSIRSVGVVQPLVVTTRAAHLAAHPDHASAIGEAVYVIIAGHRRAAAAAQAGIEALPIELRPELSSNDLDIEVMAVENLQRVDLNPVEEARLYRRLVGTGRSQRQIATRVGRAQSHISKRLALLELPAEVQEEVAAGRLDVTSALAMLSGISHARAAESDNLSVLVRDGLVHRAALSHRTHDEEAREELRDRDLCCARLASRVPTTTVALKRLAEATLALTASPEAVSLACQWLRSAGIGPEADGPVEYARIVQGAPARLRVQVAHAIVLAADELLVASGAPWEARQAAHVRRLVKEVGYLPSPEEFRRLAGMGESAASGTEPEAVAAGAGDSGGITEGRSWQRQ